MIAYFKVLRAFFTNNKNGKKLDVHGRNYRDVYKKYGHKVMLYDYLHGNSWCIR